MRVNCNISAIIASNQLNMTENALSQSIERLSSGLRINHASDDASGMAVSKKMHTQLKALERANSNTTDGISVVQTAEASLGEIENILQRMRELSVQAANGINTDSDRAAIQREIDSLSKEVDRISSDTEYNTMPLLDGTLRRRAYCDTDDINMNSMSDSVAGGEYTLSVTVAAEYATTSLNPAELVGVEGSVFVNSVEVKLETTDSAKDVYEKMVEAANKAGLTIETDDPENPSTIDFSEKRAGSLFSIDVSVSESLYGQVNVDGQTLTKNMPKATVVGKDAEVALNTGSDFSATATYRAEGNWITIRDVNNFEMVMEVPVGATPTDFTFKVTDIGTMGIQVGANEGQQIAIDIPTINSHTLRIDAINCASEKGAGTAINQLDAAIERVSLLRSTLGAYQNRLESTQKNQEGYEENLTIALSGIEDCDMAEEMTAFTTHNVKTQAATSVLAQANERPQTVLQLLQ